MARPFGIADLYTLCEIPGQVSETVRNVIKKEDSTRWFLPFFETETGIPPPRHHPKHQRVFLVSAMLSILANERMVAIVDDVWHIDVTFLRQGLTL